MYIDQNILHAQHHCDQPIDHHCASENALRPEQRKHTQKQQQGAHDQLAPADPVSSSHASAPSFPLRIAMNSLPVMVSFS